MGNKPCRTQQGTKMGAGQEDKFCLRWNDFENNISSAFRELRDDKDFFDVTLACEDNQIQAHKVILSACSPFFKSVLRKNPHQHPLLYLKDVQYEIILAILNFMYHGEVNIAQEDLNSFLVVAEDLKVKGLTQNQNNSNNQKNKAQDHAAPANKSQNYPLHSSPVKNNFKPQLQTVVNKQVHEQIKTEAPLILECEDDDQTQMVLSSEYQVENSGYEDYGEGFEEEQIEENYEQVQEIMNGSSVNNSSWNKQWSQKHQFSCDICYKTFANKRSLQNHAASHTGRTTCQICQKVFSSTTNLNQHARNTHQVQSSFM